MLDVAPLGCRAKLTVAARRHVRFCEKRLLLLFLQNLVRPSEAWWGHGHCLVLQVAEFVLQNEHPSVLEVAKNILLEYAEHYPRDSSFVGSATWSDNLNSEGFTLFKTWHYYDQPYVLDANVSVPANITDAPNMIWALDECTKGLSSKYKTASPWAASFYLRWLHHLMGDLHQPLHNVAQYSRDIADSQGDRGGNGCLLNVEASNISASTKNLHSFFDSAGGQFMFDPFFPPGGPGLTPRYKAMFEEQASELMSEFPRAGYNASYIEDINFAKWSREGYDLAVSMAYNGNGAPGLVRCGPKINITLTPAYIAKVQRVTRERIVIGGYRLAHLLVAKIPFAQWMPPANESAYHEQPPSPTLSEETLYEELRKVLLELYNGTIPGGMPAPPSTTAPQATTTSSNNNSATAAVTAPPPSDKAYTALEMALVGLLGVVLGAAAVLAVRAVKRWRANRSLEFRRMDSSSQSQLDL